MDQVDVSPEEKKNELSRVEMVILIFKIREKSVSTDQR